ncbi:hypothetical protein FRUB_06497 [Fimbriiglobus ruber]|uniref:Uncharacterized protein n=1 Tax=Fimbriiglobus ruber TaxID=1908690 RepID=A0A225DMF9_9BACT|nr:hypothetical protein FRUB_06497 [Fimbriiglobus ruber]
MKSDHRCDWRREVWKYRRDISLRYRRYFSGLAGGRLALRSRS